GDHDHVTQAFAHYCRRGLGWCGCACADFGVGLGWPWLAWRLARRLGLRRTPLLCRRARLLRLRLWRLLCSAAGADPVGTALAAGQSLLLNPDETNAFGEPRFREPGLRIRHQLIQL